MKHPTPLLAVLFSVLILLCSCQKGISTLDPDPVDPDGRLAVKFQVMQIEQVPFSVNSTTRAAIVDLCNHISLAVYKGDTKTTQINQTASDSNFGTLSLSLDPGTYRVVIIAHNGEKTPTMTSAEKIAFDGKVTDTFYYSDEVNITDASTHAISLQRCVAMFRLAVTDQIPSAVTTMRFYYTGGSSTFDAIHGVGIVNSRQTELRTVTPDMIAASANGTTTFDVYTFPRADSNTLNMTVTAHDSGNNIQKEAKFEQVAISRNMITLYTGAFFGGTSSDPSSANFHLTTNDEWTTVSHNY